MTQQQADKRYLEIADIWSRNSQAERLKVGAIIVKDNMIISDGFNGTPSGFDNWCEDYYHPKTGELIKATSQECFNEVVRCGFDLKTKPEVLHAEANAITKVAKSTQSCDGATLYCTDACCIECAKLIIQSGIKRFVYSRPFRKTEGIELLKKAKIEVVKYD